MNLWHSLPAELCALVEHTPATVLLESAKPNGSHRVPARSRLFIAPLRILQASQPEEIPALFAEIESAIAAGHFAAGYFAYECGQCFEPKAALRPSDPDQPLAWFGIYARSYPFDHATGAFVDGDPPGLAPLQHDKSVGLANPESEDLLEVRLDLTEPQYAERIAAIHEWIRSGDTYQLNFTVPLRFQTALTPAALYGQLRNRQPVDYGAFLHWQPGRRVLCFSPELFFYLEDDGSTRRIRTRPMKGTAPRGRTTSEDRAQAEWLRNDAKNRAENVMIVDLLRNDLGRLCTPGSVRVEKLFATERYPTLWQMTSSVIGELRSGIDYQQIFRALFPCGSITGAPKVRAMQLLAQLEPVPRGIYTGAIGFFSQHETIFNVAIRTLELDGRSGERNGTCKYQQGKMGVGGGIVIDSDAADEFRECQLKASFLTSSPKQLFARVPDSFSLVETLLWKESYPFLEQHLDRLEDSADYFDFVCSRTRAKAALLAHAAAFTSLQPRKVRMLLDRDGSLHIASEILPPSTTSGSCAPVRVRIAQQRTDPRDPMLFHKTTHRPLYAEAWKTAMEAGFEDVLFLNEREEVTESAIANIFLEKNGHWVTPPVECGLLAGVQRRQLLETRPGAEERVLSLEDLRQADAIYLSNAVRGLRRILIDWQDYAGRPHCCTLNGL
jgi:para-aminobenzoate synthetase/4-amino-4-deoxychorismate lyase